METASDNVGPDVLLKVENNVANFHMLTRKAVEWMVNSLAYEAGDLRGPTVLTVGMHYAVSIVFAAESRGLNVKIA
jgi:hypothetical protein